MGKLRFLCTDAAIVLLVCIFASAHDHSFSFVFPPWDCLKSCIWHTRVGGENPAGETAYLFLSGKFLGEFLRCNCVQPCVGQIGRSSLHEQPVATFAFSVTDFPCGRKKQIKVNFWPLLLRQKFCGVDQDCVVCPLLWVNNLYPVPLRMKAWRRGEGGRKGMRRIAK